MTSFLESGERAKVEGRLLYLAWRRYRIPSYVAEDLVQSALVTFLEVKDRYPEEQDHARILVGIFRNKCREHVETCVRTERRSRAIRQAGGASWGRVLHAPDSASGDEGVLEELVRQEDASFLRRALSDLRPSAKEMFRLIVDEGASRKDLIERYGLNKNTLDSRLHTYRREFRQILSRRGIDL